ncbi:YdcH family protein [Pannonibacter sp.]|uniref:YdcH family protein n=1 Tax=Pannonibacter sp. TaxID=1906786 RepID=UPI0039424CAB
MHRKLVALRVRHAILDAKIERESRRPHADSLRLTMLKKLRLRLKEEVLKLEREFFRKPAQRGGVVSA